MLGYPEFMKRVELFAKDEIKRYSEQEKVFSILRNEFHIQQPNSLNDRGNYFDSYELIELAPKLFKNIRRMSKISSRAIMDIFSLKFLKDIEISLTKSKGGSFYIRPGNGLGRIVIKSISVPEYNIIKEFLPQYYCHLLMNPNTYLVPILGAYKLKLLENEDITPIAFVLMRDVLDINRNQIGPYDRLYSFEFKGK